MVDCRQICMGDSANCHAFIYEGRTCTMGTVDDADAAAAALVFGSNGDNIKAMVKGR